MRKIRAHINEQKLLDIKKFEGRADFKQVLCLRADFHGEIQEILEKDHLLHSGLFVPEDDNPLGQIVKLDKRTTDYENVLVDIA